MLADKASAVKAPQPAATFPRPFEPQYQNQGLQVGAGRCFLEALISLSTFGSLQHPTGPFESPGRYPFSRKLKLEQRTSKNHWLRHQKTIPRVSLSLENQRNSSLYPSQWARSTKTRRSKPVIRAFGGLLWEHQNGSFKGVPRTSVVDTFGRNEATHGFRFGHHSPPAQTRREE